MTGSAITDSKTSKMCHLSGLNKSITRPELVEKIKTMGSLVKSLKDNIQEVSQAKSDADFLSAMLRGARFAKAGSLLVLDLISTWVPAGKVGGALGKAAVENAETIGEASVGKFSAAKATSRLVKSTAGVAGKMTGGTVDAKVAAYLGKKSADTGDVIVDALNGKLDESTGLKFGVGSNLDTFALAFDMAKKDGLKKVTQTAKATFAFATDVYKAQEEYKKNLDANEGLDGAKRTAIAQLEQLQAKLDSLLGDLEACDAEAGPVIELRMT